MLGDLFCVLSLPEEYTGSHVGLPPVNEWQPPGPNKTRSKQPKGWSTKKESTMDEVGKGGSVATVTNTEPEALQAGLGWAGASQGAVKNQE